MTEAFDYAFRPLAQGGAGLDFITLSDYVTDTAWGEIGRYQPAHPGKLIVRSSEVITYRGHANNHASLRYVDHRTGPVYEFGENGDLRPVRAARPPSALFDGVHAGGGFTQINHPRIFPSEVPGFDFLCRGCPWDYTAAETDYRAVDAVEIATGPAGLKEDPQPGPNPFTPLAIQFWEDAMDAGGQNANRIAAVGSSDSHNAGRAPDPVTQSPIGQATTVVYADELSERGIQRGVEARHTYVKVFGNDGPDLRFEALPPGASGPPAIMGDAVPGGGVQFTARVTGAGPGAVRPGSYTLFVLKDGAPLLVRARDRRRLLLRLPRGGCGPLPAAAPARERDRGRFEPDLGRAPGLPRPRGATPLRVSLVPAYRACEVANRQHGPPLAFGSCAPAALETHCVDRRDAGRERAPGRLGCERPPRRAARGPAHLGRRGRCGGVRGRERRARAGNARGPHGRADRPRLPADHRPRQRHPARRRQRSRDRHRHCRSKFRSSAQRHPAAAGGTCSTSTTVDALIPGAVAEGRRAIWAFGQVEVVGPDGRPFLRQGVFAP